MGFSQSWAAEILTRAPLIAPARQFTYPQNVPGEEDALARGALQVLVRPARGGAYLVTCALGFSDPAMLRGVYACPNPYHLCALAGGYAYLADTNAPENCTLLGLRPVVQVMEAGGVLLFVGFHSIVAWGVEGLAWQSGRLSWEGVTVTGVTATHVEGLGWDMRTDREVPFWVSLADGSQVGGAFPGNKLVGPI